MLLLQLGNPADSSVARGFFSAAAYTEVRVCERLGLDRLYQDLDRSEKSASPVPSEIPDHFDALLGVFLAGKLLK